ncbi:MAG: hypothetical protein WC635_11005 [Bacteriovorax sp.]|jgi:pyroglutamyl-peptidase
MNKRVLISGFEPFDGDAVNPSAVLLDWLKTKEFNFELHTALLPVSFTYTFPVLQNEIEKFKPTHVVLTGLAKNRIDLTIERIGINWVDARIPDNDGLSLKSKKILEKGEDGLFTTLPIDAMLEAARSVGCPVKVSTTAGEYVCNHVIYSYLARYRNVPGTFIHIPAAVDHEIFFQGVEAILLNL